MKAKTNDKNSQVYSQKFTYWKFGTIPITNLGGKKYHTQRQRNTSLQTAFARSPQPLTHCQKTETHEGVRE